MIQISNKIRINYRYPRYLKVFSNRFINKLWGGEESNTREERLFHILPFQDYVKIFAPAADILFHLKSFDKVYGLLYNEPRLKKEINYVFENQNEAEENVI